MAINLSGKADASIVSAAKAAGKALEGPDYSKSFQAMATGYKGAMSKMGAGLAKAASVGAVAVSGLVKDIKEAKTRVGDQAVGFVMGEMKDLIGDRLKIFGMSGEEKEAAKLKFQKDKETAFGAFKAMRDGTYMAEQMVSQELMNEAAAKENPLGAMQMQAITNKGEPIKEGPFAGVYSKMEKDENGEFSIRFYGEDDAPVTGINEDGTPAYGGEKGVKQRAKSRASKPAKKLPAAVQNFTVESDKTNTSKVTDLQKVLKDNGYDLGSAGVDGKFGPKTQAAFDKFKEDNASQQVSQQRALMDELAGYDASKDVPLSVAPNAISSLITAKEPEARANLTQIDLDNLQNGQKGFKFRGNEVRNQVLEQVNTDNKFKDLTNARLADAEYTYAEQLGMPSEFTASMWKDITSVAAGMDGVKDTGGPDGKPDNKIDENDFTESDANNMMILRKAMLDPSNPVAKEIFADWYTGEVKKTHESGAAMRQEKLNRSQRKDTETQSNKPFAYPSTQQFKGGITGGQLNSLLNGLRAGKLDQQDGTSINLNKQTGMWESSDTTDEYTGAEVIGFMQTSLGDDAYNIRLDENFKPFMTSGTATGTHNPGNPSHLQNLPAPR